MVLSMVLVGDEFWLKMLFVTDIAAIYGQNRLNPDEVLLFLLISNIRSIDRKIFAQNIVSRFITNGWCRGAGIERFMPL